MMGVWWDFCKMVSAGFLFAGLYGNLDVYDLHDAVFLSYVLLFMYMVNEDLGDIHSLDYSYPYGIFW